MASQHDYKGYKIHVTGSAGGKSPYSPAVFHIYGKRGEQAKLIHTGKVEGTFRSSQDAFRAAHDAARAWIDNRRSLKP